MPHSLGHCSDCSAVRANAAPKPSCLRAKLPPRGLLPDLYLQRLIPVCYTRHSGVLSKTQQQGSQSENKHHCKALLFRKTLESSIFKQKEQGILFKAKTLLSTRCKSPGLVHSSIQCLQVNFSLTEEPIKHYHLLSSRHS